MIHFKYLVTSAVLLSSFLIPTSSNAQKPSIYTNVDGLVGTRIDHILCDDNNFLWVTTNLGLSRFDGQTFKTYSKEEDNPYGLQDNQITYIFEDKNKNYWVGASDGLYAMDRTLNSFTRIDPNLGGLSFTVTSIADHPTLDNHLIITTAGYGIWIFNTQNQTFDETLGRQLNGTVLQHNIPVMTADNHHRVWTFYHEGFSVIDIDNMARIDTLKGILPEECSQLIVQATIIDKIHDCLYLGTADKGLYRCNLYDLRIEHLNIPALDSKNITALCLNPHGQLMVGTEGQGLFTVNPFSLEAQIIDDVDCPVDLRHAKVHSINYNNQQDLCLGIFQKGVLIWPAQSSLFKYKPIKESNQSLYNIGCVGAFASLPDGTRIYGIDGAGIVIQAADGTIHHLSTNNSELESDAIMDFVTTPQGRIYVGTYLHGLYELKLPQGQIKRIAALAEIDHVSVMTLAYDTLTHQLFIGTNGSGLYVYDDQADKLQSASDEYGHRWAGKLYIDSQHQLWYYSEGTLSLFNIERLSFRFVGRPKSVRIYGFAEDPKTHQLFMASDKGIFTFNAQTDSIEVIPIDQLTDRESFASILRSDDGRLWLSSNKGILSYNPADGMVTRYQDSEIAQIGSFGRRSGTQWSDGTFCFGGDNGIVTFTPSKVASYTQKPRPIYFTSLWINNEPTDYNPNISPDDNVLDEALWTAQKLTLPPSRNNFSISFAIQEYFDVMGANLAYMLEGYDKEWHETHSNNMTANYSSIPTGKYIFKVKTLDNGGNEPISTAQLKIEVLPNWYVTWWGILIWAIIGIVLLISIYHFFRIRQHNRRIIRRAAQERQIKEAKLRMFTDVSNEIRTPLTLIIAPLRDLLNRKVDHSTMEIYENLYNNALRIFMLVNQQKDIAEANHAILKELQENKVTENVNNSEEKQLAASLQVELKEKQQLRERRSNLAFDYTQVQMSSADEKLLNRVVECIHKNITDAEFCVETLSEKVGISRVHLNRKLKELIDSSPSALIKSVRMKQAAVLLIKSDATVAEIAYSVGFTSPAYFTSNFSQFYGMTPKELVAEYKRDPENERWAKLLE